MGAFEEVKGKGKQAAGDMADDPDLRREGQAQEEKADAANRADDALAEARAHEARARDAQVAEETAQADKEV